jgi:superfamily II DNA or RNA helicase
MIPTTPEAPSPTQGFSDLELDIHYEGPGEEILARFVLPVLQAAASYDRLTSFFSVSSLLAIAQGIESLWRRGGRMRLILGIHDVPEALAHAATEDIPELTLAAVRQRLLDKVSTLRDELSRDRLATLAWMMQDNLLQVRVATPLSAGSGAVAGVFHSKRFVFRDAEGEMITAVGSPNETLLGLGANFEEIDVHMSWQDPMGYATRHAESFERIWQGNHKGIRVVELDQAFAAELLSHLGSPRRNLTAAWKRTSTQPGPAQVLLELARRSPAWAPFNLTAAALYPHQERVFMDALGRWPVRVLLADEVGLGKTLEAGIVIAYALRFLGLHRVIVLAPAGLLRQWQDEMRIHFNLDFWRYDSGSRAFLSSEGAVRTVPQGARPIGVHSPDLVLMSSQLARGSRRLGHLLDGDAALPDMLVVDEAHSARVRVDTDGASRPTLMWRLVDDVKGKIPHLVLLSATPMQLDPTEYHSLLHLLGLPEWWSEPGRLGGVLNILSSTTAPGLQAVKDALMGIASTMEEMNPDRNQLGLSSTQQQLLDRLRDEVEVGAGEVVAARNRWADVYSTLVKTHPGHLLTIRNTRGALMSLGYSFPERRFSAPPLSINQAVADFYSMADVYLESAFGRVEAAQHPERAKALGFMKSTYRQRLASSLRAAELSLRRRVARIEEILSGNPVPDTADDEEMDAEWEDAAELPSAEVSSSGAMIEQACRIELGYLHDLVRQLEDLEVKDLGKDPKLDMLMELIGQHLANGDQLLVFSRYTDTVDACVELFLERHAGEAPSHAKYTGGASWVDAGDGPLPVTKEDIRRALDEGEVRLVFCSDAASEGLNLQAARVVINVDVPWNPARLEQRIGRIARLGQKAAEVDIYNLWYPDSVEAKIYDRLLKRRDLYQLAVGEFPEIVGSAIRKELASRYEAGAAAISEDPIQILQSLRESQQRAAIQRIWDVELSPRPESQRFREALADLVARAGDGSGISNSSVYAGESDVISLMHPALDSIVQASVSEHPDPIPVLVVCSGSVPIGFVLEEADEFVVVPAMELPALLAWIALGDELHASESWVRVPRSSIDRLYREVADASRWMPKPTEMRCLIPEPLDASDVESPRSAPEDMSLVRLTEVMNYARDT